MSKPETITIVLHFVQGSFSNGLEWEPWQDMPNQDGDEDPYAAIGKAELFHHFMTHGVYPEQYMQDPAVQIMLPVLQAIRRAVIKDRVGRNHKVRTRVIRRTIVSTITEEEIDKPMAENLPEIKT